MSPDKTNPVPFDAIMRTRDVTAALSISRPTLWRLVKTGQFPAPLKVTRSLNGWRRSVVDAYLDGCELGDVDEVAS